MPGAVDGRKDPQVEVFGMTGIPDDVVDASGSDSVPDKEPPPAAKSTGPTTIPPRDFSVAATAPSLGAALSASSLALGVN